MTHDDAFLGFFLAYARMGKKPKSTSQCVTSVMNARMTKMLKRIPVTRGQLIRVDLGGGAYLLLTRAEYVTRIERAKREKRTEGIAGKKELTEKTGDDTLRNNDGSRTQTDPGAARLDSTEACGHSRRDAELDRQAGATAARNPGVIGAVDPDDRGAGER
jgi:hypothetical protein